MPACPQQGLENGRGLWDYRRWGWPALAPNPRPKTTAASTMYDVPVGNMDEYQAIGENE